MTTLRKYRTRDYADIEELHARAVNKLRGAGWYSARCLNAWSATFRLGELGTSSWRIVAVAHGRAIGYGELKMGRGVGEIAALYVDPKFQCKGVGKELLQALEQRARRLRLLELRLQASVNAAGFYKQNGYRRVGRDIVTIADTRMVVVAMVKTLPRTRGATAV